MRFEAMARTYDTFGGHAILSLVPEFLLWEAPDFGPAIMDLGITFNFPHAGPPRRTLNDLYRRFHASRNVLPKIVYRRKRAQVEIDIASDLISGENWHDTHGVPLPLFQRAAIETVAALALLGQRLTAKDDFDLDAFLAHCNGALLRLPSTQEELSAFMQESERRWHARKASASPWDALDIDWRDYHPDARRILDSPFYWECENDFAPHGNDTGADLLEDYRKWFRRNPGGDPIVFYRTHVARWGFPADSSEDSVRTLLDDAAVALAFAELKLRAECHSTVMELARDAVRRQRQRASEAIDRPHRAEGLKSLDAISEKLSKT